MEKRKSKQKLLSFFSIFLTAFSFVALVTSGTAAWFVTKTEETVEGINGSLLTKYFHEGDGAEDTPFVITRPKHYENMIKLFYDLPGFADQTFYFEFGYDLAGNGTKQFYEYDDNLRLTGPTNYTDKLNCKGLGYMPPLGTQDQPFNSVIEGNGLTISHLNIAADGHNDVGVFGFVLEDAVIKNAYYEDFVIDTTQASTTIHPHTEDPERVNQHDSNDVVVGYLAGHVYNASSFVDVYVNKCDIINNNKTTNFKNNYGYFGIVEIDATSGTTGQGKDYSFRLSAKDTYDYFVDKYSGIKDLPLVGRDTAESATYDEDGNLVRGEKEIYSGGQPVKFSDVVQPSGNSTYKLGSSNRTASLSTIGYRSGPVTPTQKEYNRVYYKETETTSGSGTDVPSDAMITQYSRGTQPKSGKFIYIDPANDNKWSYYQSYNTEIDESITTTTLTINFSDIKLLETSSVFAADRGTLTNISANLYFDDNTNPISLTYSYNPTNQSGLNKTSEHKITINPVTMTVDLGKHFYYLSITFTCTGHTSLSGSLNGNYGCTYPDNSSEEKELPTYNQMSSGSVTTICNLSPTVSAVQNQGHPSNVVKHECVPETQGIIATTTTAYKPMYGDIEGVSSNLRLHLTDSQNTAGSVDRLSLENGSWKGYYTTWDIDDNSDPSLVKNHMIGDEDELTHDSVAGQTGYNDRNIDVVGNNITFSVYSVLGTTLEVIDMKSETSSTYRVPKIPASQRGQPFYATDYCNESVVLYIRNTGNAALNRNDVVGHIAFKYINVWGLGSDTICFKKGNGVYTDFTGGSGSIEYTLEFDLTEQQVKERSYVCLDKDRNFLGTFSQTGVWEGQQEDLSKIAFYVMCIGSHRSSGSGSAKITEVNFTFEAEEGYGGIFNAIGYRSAPDKFVDDGADIQTVLNFYFYFEGDKHGMFRFYVYYDRSTKTYNLTVGSEKAMTIEVYNYYTSIYSITINGVAQSNTAHITYSIPANSYTYSRPT